MIKPGYMCILSTPNKNDWAFFMFVFIFLFAFFLKIGFWSLFDFIKRTLGAKSDFIGVSKTNIILYLLFQYGTCLNCNMFLDDCNYIMMINTRKMSKI